MHHAGGMILDGLAIGLSIMLDTLPNYSYGTVCILHGPSLFQTVHSESVFVTIFALHLSLVI
jgi:hypothetical protein